MSTYSKTIVITDSKFLPPEDFFIAENLVSNNDNFIWDMKKDVCNIDGEYITEQSMW